MKRLETRIVFAGYSNGFSLKNIFFTLDPGEILVVTGRSGSGKTTLLRAISGLIRLRNGYVKGSIRIDSEEIIGKSLEYIGEKIFYMPQEPWYGIIGYTVLTEYCHTLSVYGIKCIPEKLGEYGLSGLENKVTYGLSAGQYQRILWAEAIELRKPLILMDEPYTYIDSNGRNQFRKYVEKYIGDNGSLIIVDHILSNWKTYEPKLLVLDHGRIIYYGKYREDYELKTSIVRREKRSGKDIVLEARNIWFKYPGSHYVLKGADLVLKRGEIIGVSGVNGSGKTTLLKVLAGIYKPSRGKIIRSGSIIYVPENPILYFTHPIPREEIYSSVNNRVLIEKIVRDTGVKELLDKPLAVLSTGEKRRVALVSALVSGYDIFLLDEPTGGLDKYSVEVLLDIIDYMASRGASILITYHDPRLNGFFDHEYLLVDGVLKCLS